MGSRIAFEIPADDGPLGRLGKKEARPCLLARGIQGFSFKSVFRSNGNVVAITIMLI